MTLSNTDRVEKRIELAAPISRVWLALTDYRQFGQWFRVNLETAFVVGKSTRGHVTYQGYEHLKFEAVVEAMEPERRFSFRWHPFAIDPNVDYSSEPATLVEFLLRPIGTGTELIVTESGFDALPASRRDEAFRMNNQGWSIQLNNIEAFLLAPS